MKPIRLTPHTRKMAIQSVIDAPDGYVFTAPKPPVRSLDQNALVHAWYAEIAGALPEDDAMGWKCYCKLHHGVPIMRAEDDEFRSVYDSAIKGLPYEKKLSVMKYFPVTSLMNKKQLSKYAEAVRDDFAAKCVFLEFPEESQP